MMKACTTLVVAIVLAAGPGLTPGPGPAAHVEGPPPAVGLVAAQERRYGPDFDADGWTDAAVGDPDATVNGQAKAGRVVIMYGDRFGIGEGRRTVITQATIGQGVETGDRFGAALASADLDVTIGTDLVIGTPGEDVGSTVDAGAVHLLFGSPDGLGRGVIATRTLNQSDLGGTDERGDQLGAAVVATNANGDTSEVTVGAPGEDLGGLPDAGVIHGLSVIAVDAGGDPLHTSSQRGQDSAGIPGSAGAGHRFGASLASVFDEDLLVGAPGDTVGRAARAGSVTSIPTYAGEPGFEITRITQDSPGVPGTAEAGDEFGYSLAAAAEIGPLPVNPDYPRFVAVGVPGEDLGSIADAGAVQLFTSRWRDGFVPDVLLSQASPEISGDPEPGDRFGHAVALLGAGRSTSAYRLAVGTPLEDLGAVADAGLVQVITLAGNTEIQALNQNSAGVPGSIHAGGRFGSPVTSLESVLEDVFLVGMPFQGTGAVLVRSYGQGQPATRSWVPGTDGVPLAGSKRFGWSINGYDSVS